jgi:hypothetical protein
MKQPLSEVMNMPYWKFEQFVERLNRKNEHAESERKKHEDGQKGSDTSSGSNMSKYNPKNFLSGFKMPKF